MQTFNKMIDRKMAASPVDGLIVYPEGAELADLLDLKNLIMAAPCMMSFSESSMF